MKDLQAAIEKIDAVLAQPEAAGINEAIQLLEKAALERAELAGQLNIATVLLHGMMFSATKERMTDLLKGLQACLKGNTEFLHWARDNTADKIDKLNLLLTYGADARDTKFDEAYARLLKAADLATKASTEAVSAESELLAIDDQLTLEFKQLKAKVVQATSFVASIAGYVEVQQSSSSASTAQGVASEPYDFEIIEQTLLLLSKCNKEPAAVAAAIKAMEATAAASTDIPAVDEIKRSKLG